MYIPCIRENRSRPYIHAPNGFEPTIPGFRWLKARSDVTTVNIFMPRFSGIYRKDIIWNVLKLPNGCPSGHSINVASTKAMTTIIRKATIMMCY
jgi:hypothetical protein